MSSDLFIKYDVASGQVLQGPCTLSASLLELTMEELNAQSWYLVLPQWYDVGPAFDPNVFIAVDVVYQYTDIPYPAIRKLITTTPRPLVEVKRYVALRFTEFRNALFDAGFIYGDVEFDADFTSRLNWTAANAAITSQAFLYGLNVTTLDSLPGYQAWTRRDNNTAHFKRTEILQCGVKLASWASDCFQYCRQKKTDVILATTFEEVWGIWTSNDASDWPNRNLGGTLALPQPSVNENLVSRPAEEQNMLKDDNVSMM